MRVAAPLDAPELPCPECRLHGCGGGARIGNRRNKCVTCNNWAQNVMRLTRKLIVQRYPEEYQRMRQRAELDLYPQVLEDFITSHPAASGEQE